MFNEKNTVEQMILDGLCDILAENMIADERIFGRIET